MAKTIILDKRRKGGVNPALPRQVMLMRANIINFSGNKGWGKNNNIIQKGRAG